MQNWYAKAKGQMLEVFATCECPICGDEMVSLDMTTENYDERGDWHFDTYVCSHCCILLTYITPAKYHNYHDVPDGEKYYLIENQ